MSRWNEGRREEGPVSWGWAEIVFLSAFVVAGLWFIETHEVGLEVVDFLRRNFFVFVREPLLQAYVYREFQTLLLKSAAIFLVALLLVSRGRKFWSSLGFLRARRPTRNLTLVFVSFSIGVAFLEGLDPLSPGLPTALFFEESAWIGNLLVLFSLAIVAPLTEEMFFRGFVYPALSQRLGPVVSIGLTAFVFFAAHLPRLHGDWTAWGLILFVSIFMTWARAWSGSTRYTVFLHAFYNLSLSGAGLVRYWLYGR